MGLHSQVNTVCILLKQWPVHGLTRPPGRWDFGCAISSQPRRPEAGHKVCVSVFNTAWHVVFPTYTFCTVEIVHLHVYNCTFARSPAQCLYIYVAPLNWPAGVIHCIYTGTQGVSSFESKREMFNAEKNSIFLWECLVHTLHVTCFNTYQYQCEAPRARTLRFTCHCYTLRGKLVRNWTCHWTQTENFPNLFIFFGEHITFRDMPQILDIAKKPKFTPFTHSRSRHNSSYTASTHKSYRNAMSLET